MKFALYLATRTMDGNYMLAVKPTLVVVGERADAWKAACRQQAYFDPAVAYITIYPAGSVMRADEKGNFVLNPLGDTQLGWY